MATNAGAASGVTHEEFEPFCKWQREEARDTLIVHLPEFKKEQLRVHIDNRGILKVSGERSIDALKKSKFYKEVVVPRNCKTNAIQAKFAKNHLYLIMPKNGPSAAVPEQNKPQQAAADQNTKPETGKDQAAPQQEPGSKKEETVQSPTPNGNEPRKSDTVDETKQGSASRGKELTKMVVNAGMVMLLLAAIMAFVLYMYKSTIVED